MNTNIVLIGAAGVGALLLLLARPSRAAVAVPPSPDGKTPPKPPPAPPGGGTASGGSAVGRLAAAARAGKLAPIRWTPVRVGDLEVSVASDALAADGVRWPVTFNEALEIARSIGAVLPTKAMADAIYGAAVVRVPARGQGTSAMKAEGTVRKFSSLIDKDLAGKDGLAAGGWKHFLLDARLPTSKGAVIYGFWSNGAPIQMVSGAHDASYTDYSQLLQPVKREAKKISTGETVDLLDVINSETSGTIKPWLDRLS